MDKDEITKVLGLCWDPSKDVLTFAQRTIPITCHVTKRFVLKHSSQIYDPLGLLSPVSVRAKILMQEIWKQKLDWDIPLPENLHKVWNCIAKDLNTVTQITFSRQYLSNPTESEKRRLHIFVDASMASYGAAAFICDKEESRLVMAKNGVAPLKTLTLPKLELMAALIGARLADHLQSTFPATNVTMWSDSQLVLHWIATVKVLPKFVANRVKEIRDLTGQYKWKYCPTKDNPADLLTRGITANNFMKNDLWMTGPDWLCDRNRWPMWEFSENQVQILLEEPGCTQMLITDQTARSSPEGNIQNVMRVQKYSRLNKLLRVTGYVLRFIKNCKAGRANAKLDPLFASELQQAQLLWIRGCQATYYREELQELKTSKPRASLIRQLRLFLDPTGAIRCGGRIHNAAVDDVTKFPYLLPNKDILTTLMIQAAHELHGHSGLNSTVTNIRQKFWIPAMRQCVNAVIWKCVICRKVQGNPYKSPEVPPLPKLRVKEAPAFTVTGVDFTGALYIKNPTGTEAKAYVCLFTCAVKQSRISRGGNQHVRRLFSTSLPEIRQSKVPTFFDGIRQC